MEQSRIPLFSTDVSGFEDEAEPPAGLENTLEPASRKRKAYALTRGREKCSQQTCQLAGFNVKDPDYLDRAFKIPVQKRARILLQPRKSCPNKLQRGCLRTIEESHKMTNQKMAEGKRVEYLNGFDLEGRQRLAGAALGMLGG
ncbi:hypothetical protein K0M31_019724 [Melipona bicolor]|uniref:Uncharacterized protein n=1 Tax=Melipona bicolor TaxID=60889 RepID=A0AA40G3U6_9HYME|nr:hypothetical protein K0M31_019724 [Melipona bicolor]